MKTQFSIVLISFLLLGCSSSRQIEEGRIQIPDSIFIKSDDIIKSMIGERFFKAYIKSEPAKSKFIPSSTDGAKELRGSHYFVIYRFYIPGYEEYENLISFHVDLNGNLLSKEYVDGIPQCPSNDCWDTFHVIDKSEAVKIAKGSGLEDGLNEWKLSLHYYGGNIRDYVWGIENTLGKDNGRSVIIEARTGKVEGIYEWMRMQ